MKKLLERLTRPAAGIETATHRQQARILASLLLLLLLAILIISPIWIITAPDFAGVRYISLGILLSFILAYGLSRTRYYKAGVVVLILTIIGMVVAILLTAPGPTVGQMPALNFLVVPVLIATLFLRRRFTLLITAIGLAIISVFFFVPDVPFPLAYAHLVFFLLIAALGIISSVLGQHYRQRLAESEIRYRSMFEDNLAVKLLIDPDTGMIIDANSAAADFYGYSHQELCAMRIQDINTLTEAEVRAEMALARSEKRKVFNFRHRLASGEIRDVEVFSGPVAAQGKQYLYSIILDVTARKKAEEALRRSEERLRALLKAMPDLMFRNSRDGVFLDYHAGAPADLALSPAQFIGKKIKDVLPLELAQQHMNCIEQALQSGEEVVYEYAMPIDGQLKNFEARMVVSGQDEVLTIVRNITERKEARQREFELALEQERGRLLRQFIEKASHEFRTPLTVINTNAYLLERLQKSEKGRLKTEAIQTQVNHITKLVDRLLLMIRLESDADMPHEPVNIAPLLEIVRQNMATRYGDAPRLQWTSCPDLPAVMGNPNDLMIAIKQILDNAYRFTPADGEITFSASVKEKEIWLEVCDAGPGIPAEKLPHIFETFWRQDEAHNTPGLGLGLPIAQKIISRHGGEIEVESKIGAGTIFRIILPFNRLPGKEK